jgi:tetratricopeptide (TPR) repeat protein
MSQHFAGKMQQPLQEDAADASLGHPLRGISVHYLSTTFKTEVLSAGCFSTDSTIYELEPAIIRSKGQRLTCPRDGGLGTAYVDAVEGPDNVGKATCMLSYTWGYSMLGDVIPSLMQHCKDANLDPKRTYVWICCLCVNQHRVKEMQKNGQSVPFSEFQATFTDRVKTIGHVLVLMSPWQSPEYLRRLWCVFELHTAIATQTEVTVLMPPAQKASLCKTLMLCSKSAPTLQLYKALTDVDVEKAKASVDEDSRRILEIIRSPLGPGIKKLNADVQKFLKQWFLQAMENEFSSLLHGHAAIEEKAELCSNIAKMLFTNGHHSRAMEILEAGMKVVEHGDMPSPLPGMRAYASILATAAFLDMKQGKLENSAKAFEQAKAMFLQCGMFVSVAGAKLCDAYGALLRKTDNLEGAIDVLMQGYQIYKALNQSDTCSVACLLGNIGYVNELQGDLRAASKMYEQAKDIHVRAGTLKTPAGALLLTSLAKLSEHQGALDVARMRYKEALEIREATSTLRTPAGAVLLAWAGSLKARLHDLEGSQAAYQLAKEIRIDFQTLDTPDGMKLLEAMSH